MCVFVLFFMLHNKSRMSHVGHPSPLSLSWSNNIFELNKIKNYASESGSIYLCIEFWSNRPTSSSLKSFVTSSECKQGSIEFPSCCCQEYVAGCPFGPAACKWFSEHKKRIVHRNYLLTKHVDMWGGGVATAVVRNDFERGGFFFPMGLREVGGKVGKDNISAKILELLSLWFIITQVETGFFHWFIQKKIKKVIYFLQDPHKEIN